MAQFTLRLSNELADVVRKAKPAAISQSAFLHDLIELGLFTYQEDLHESRKAIDAQPA